MGSMHKQFTDPVSVAAKLEDLDLANGQRDLLDLIDKIQFAQLDNVKLPRIVVVGDQSAGKSSVLEAITDMPFPRDADKCTRFATEIRLKRDREAKTTIRIIPDARTRSYAEQEKLKRFGATLDESTDLTTLIRHSTEQIAPKNQPGQFVARDVLVIEKKGPTMPFLTLVDLPGLVQNPNKDQSLEDIKAINDLTDRYIKSPRTIILAVIGGNQDYVQAPILIKVRNIDPAGERTIGVLTKPDLIESIGIEDKFIQLINHEDKENDLKLGWYVLRNPGPRKEGQPWPSKKERRETENEFFSKGKWSTLPPTVYGVNTLKQKLSIQLQRHIGKHLKALQKEIQKQYDACESELSQLGTGKDTVEEMREELGELCSNSKEFVALAVQGIFDNPPGESFFPLEAAPDGIPPQNLRARTVYENERFSERLRTRGQKLSLLSETKSQDTNRIKPSSLTKKEYVQKEIEPLLKQNVGTEFPMDHNPRLVYKLFRSYSEKWSKLAQEHKNNLILICNEFLGAVIHYVWPRRMHQALKTEFLDPQMKLINKKAQEQVDLLQTDLSFQVRPYDPDYKHRITAWRSETSAEGGYTEGEEVFEKMLIYYDLLAKTFITNVITQVVERHLLRDLNTIFSWANLHRMDDAVVIAITAEDKATRERRLFLKARKVAIEEAADHCASLAMRKELSSHTRIELHEIDQHSDEGDEEEDDNNTNVNQSVPESNVADRHSEEQEKTQKPHREATESQPAFVTPQMQTDQEGSAQPEPDAAASSRNDSDHGKSPLPDERRTGQQPKVEDDDDSMPGGWYDHSGHNHAHNPDEFNTGASSHHPSQTTHHEKNGIRSPSSSHAAPSPNTTSHRASHEVNLPPSQNRPTAAPQPQPQPQPRYHYPIRSTSGNDIGPSASQQQTRDHLQSPTRIVPNGQTSPRSDRSEFAAFRDGADPATVKRSYRNLFGRES